MQQSNELKSGRGAFVDPVCGMTVDPKSAAGSYEYKGTVYYFCSKHCVEKFREEPERFLNKLAAPVTMQPIGIGRTKSNEVTHTTQDTGRVYTCPMHPEVRQN